MKRRDSPYQKTGKNGTAATLLKNRQNLSRGVFDGTWVRPDPKKSGVDLHRSGSGAEQKSSVSDDGLPARSELCNTVTQWESWHCIVKRKPARRWFSRPGRL
jgi:hypothetical protein